MWKITYAIGTESKGGLTLFIYKEKPFCSKIIRTYRNQNWEEVVQLVRKREDFENLPEDGLTEKQRREIHYRIPIDRILQVQIVLTETEVYTSTGYHTKGATEDDLRKAIKLEKEEDERKN